MLSIPEPHFIDDYQLLDIIGEGSTGIVYKARHTNIKDHPDQRLEPLHKDVALKITREYDIRLIESMRAETAALLSVKHPGLVRMLKYGETNGLPWYSMDLLPKQSLREYLLCQPEQRLSLSRAAILIFELSEILSVIHANGYVHGDLKPENVSIDTSGHPILGDMNLKLEGSRSDQLGTLQYAAPEQIRGEALDARCDIYALGNMIFEILSGATPFAESKHLLTDQLQTKAPLYFDDSNNKLTNVMHFVSSMLEKAKDQRLCYTGDVMHFFRKYADTALHSRNISPAHLYQPSLAGRNTQLLEFRKYSDKATCGTFYLIKGESGVGKSAFAHRLTMLFEDAGWYALKSEAKSDSAALGLFEPILQQIVDYCWAEGPSLTQQIFSTNARTLALYLPSIKNLPGLDLSPSPRLSAETARWSVFNDLENVLLNFSGQKRISLILDDLQWADEMSIAFLAQLTANESFFKDILIIGLHRNEQSPYLERLLTTESILQRHITPLDKQSISQMVEEILVQKPPPSSLVNHIAKHGGGSPLYAIEYIHIAHMTGNLSRIASNSWEYKPNTSISSDDTDIHKVIHIHIKSLSTKTRKFASVAALLGKECNTTLVTQITQYCDEHVQQALDEMWRTRILAYSGHQRIRFSHDRYREILIETLSKSDAITLHGEIAQTLEFRVETDHQGGNMHTIAAHWDANGNTQRATIYHEHAGNFAHARLDYQNAVEHFRAALRRSDLKSAARGNLKLKLGVSIYGTGELGEAEIQVKASLKDLGLVIPEKIGTINLFAAILKFLCGSKFIMRLPESQAEDIIQASVFMAERYFFANNFVSFLTMAFIAIAHSKAADSEYTSRPYAHLGFAASVKQLHKISKYSLNKGEQIAKRFNNSSDLAYVRLARSLGYACSGDWRSVHDTSLEAIEALDSELDPAHYENHASCLASAAFHTARFSEHIYYTTSLAQIAEKRNNLQRSAWAWVFFARQLFWEQKYVQAIELLKKAETTEAGDTDGFLAYMTPSLMAIVHLRSGDTEQAQSYAIKALGKFGESGETNYLVRDAFMATASVFHELNLGTQEKQAINYLSHFSKDFPMATTMAKLYKYRSRLRSAPFLKKLITLINQSEMPLDLLTLHSICLRDDIDISPEFDQQVVSIRKKLGIKNHPTY
ncbi:MAG: protein kinase [Pseudomonadales bacterium]|nr:protein kinase [Pseudomonadales bacterium]